MEFPSWFQNGMQTRLDQVTTWIQSHPELRKFRTEENAAFNALFASADKTKLAEFMAWEDKNHFLRALENECLYLQGMRDGVQLILALLADPMASSEQGKSKD